MVQKIWQSYRSIERLVSVVLVAFIVIVGVQWVISSLLGFIPDSKDNGIYTEGLVGEVAVLNPPFVDFSQINRDFSRLVYSGLTHYNPVKKIFEPDLATFAISEDVTEYTFKLKKGLKWHDGQSITTDDVVFTFNDVIKDPNFANTLLQGVFADVEINKIDDYTVTFTLSQPNAFFLSNTITGILPKHVYKDIPVELIGSEINDKMLIGSGPYQFESLKQTENGTNEILLKAYKNYHFGKPGLKEILLKVFPSDADLLADQAMLNSIPQLGSENAKKFDTDFEVKDYQLPQYTALFLNQENPSLSTERMRKILKNAFDKNYLEATLTDKQAIGGPYFFLEEINKIPARDLGLLNDQLDELGWSINNATKIRENERGEQLKYILLVRKFDNNPAKEYENKVVVDHIVDAGKQLGIDIELVEADANEFAAKVANKAYDIVLYGQDFGYNLDAFAFWHSSQIGPNTFNLSNFQSVSADDVLEQLRNTRDQDERRSLLEKLNVILKADAPAIFLYTQKYLFAFDNSVKNRTILDDYATIADRFYAVETWGLK